MALILLFMQCKEISKSNEVVIKKNNEELTLSSFTFVEPNAFFNFLKITHICKDSASLSPFCSQNYAYNYDMFDTYIIIMMYNMT